MKFVHAAAGHRVHDNSQRHSPLTVLCTNKVRGEDLGKAVPVE
jgi:hypothetical protein